MSIDEGPIRSGNVLLNIHGLISTHLLPVVMKMKETPNLEVVISGLGLEI